MRSRQVVIGLTGALLGISNALKYESRSAIVTDVSGYTSVGLGQTSAIPYSSSFAVSNYTATSGELPIGQHWSFYNDSVAPGCYQFVPPDMPTDVGQISNTINDDLLASFAANDSKAAALTLPESELAVDVKSPLAIPSAAVAKGLVHHDDLPDNWYTIFDNASTVESAAIEPEVNAVVSTVRSLAESIAEAQQELNVAQAKRDGINEFTAVDLKAAESAVISAQDQVDALIELQTTTAILADPVNLSKNIADLNQEIIRKEEQLRILTLSGKAETDPEFTAASKELHKLKARLKAIQPEIAPESEPTKPESALPGVATGAIVSLATVAACVSAKALAGNNVTLVDKDPGLDVNDITRGQLEKLLKTKGYSDITIDPSDEQYKIGFTYAGKSSQIYANYDEVNNFDGFTSPANPGEAEIKAILLLAAAASRHGVATLDFTTDVDSSVMDKKLRDTFAAACKVAEQEGIPLQFTAQQKAWYEEIKATYPKLLITDETDSVAKSHFSSLSAAGKASSLASTTASSVCNKVVTPLQPVIEPAKTVCSRLYNKAAGMVNMASVLWQNRSALQAQAQAKVAPPKPMPEAMPKAVPLPSSSPAAAG